MVRYSRRFAVTLTVYALALVVAWGARDLNAPWFGRIDEREAQLLAFPLFLWAIARLSLWGLRLNRAVILLAGAGALTAAALTYLYPTNLKRGFLIAPFPGDTQQTASRIFRERLNAQLAPLSRVRAASYFTEVTSEAAARKVLEMKSGLRGIVWGGGRWLTISFPRERPRPLRGQALSMAPPQYSELLIVPSAPAIGLSLSPEDTTRYFLATLFSGILPKFSRERTEEGRRELFESQWTLLRDAGTIRAFWTSLAHQAYPWFLLGNRALEEAFREPELQMGYLRCALEAYRQAGDFLRKNDNPELRAGILNNTGVALILQGVFTGSSTRVREGGRYLTLARSTARERDLFNVPREAAQVAKLNLRVLETTARQGKKGAHAGSTKRALKTGNKKKQQRKKKREEGV